jgi:type II secretory ATPase GspE/PulE/Tfp pilus assembly ATPase PilB-like protein
VVKPTTLYSMLNELNDKKKYNYLGRPIEFDIKGISQIR